MPPWSVKAPQEDGAILPSPPLFGCFVLSAVSTGRVLGSPAEAPRKACAENGFEEVHW